MISENLQKFFSMPSGYESKALEVNDGIDNTRYPAGTGTFVFVDPSKGGYSPVWDWDGEQYVRTPDLLALGPLGSSVEVGGDTVGGAGGGAPEGRKLENSDSLLDLKFVSAMASFAPEQAGSNLQLADIAPKNAMVGGEIVVTR